MKAIVGLAVGLLAVAAAVKTVPAFGGVVYRDTFVGPLSGLNANGDPLDDQELALNTGWHWNAGTDGHTWTGNDVAPADGGALVCRSGVDLTDPAINSNPYSGSNAGAGRVYGVGGTRPGLLWTNEYQIAGGVAALQQLRFWERCSSGNSMAFAIEVGGNWYVTAQNASLTGNTDATADDGTWNEQTLNLTSVTWKTLAFVADTELSAAPGADALVPAGSITAFGLYEPTPTVAYGNRRFDNIEISAVVPEPGTLAVLALGGVGALLRRRRG